MNNENMSSDKGLTLVKTTLLPGQARVIVVAFLQTNPSCDVTAIIPITTGSANQRPNTPCIRLWIDVTFHAFQRVENSYYEFVYHSYHGCFFACITHAWETASGRKGTEKNCSFILFALMHKCIYVVYW